VKTGGEIYYLLINGVVNIEHCWTRGVC